MMALGIRISFLILIRALLLILFFGHLFGLSFSCFISWQNSFYCTIWISRRRLEAFFFSIFLLYLMCEFAWWRFFFCELAWSMKEKWCTCSWVGSQMNQVEQFRINKAFFVYVHVCRKRIGKHHEIIIIIYSL